MAKFTVRMVLKNGDWEDYENLHEQMELQDFSKEIKNNAGVAFELPDAEYNYVGTATLQDVLDKAKAAADTVGLKYSVLATESKGRLWHKLDKA